MVVEALRSFAFWGSVLAAGIRNGSYHLNPNYLGTVGRSRMATLLADYITKPRRNQKSRP
jgi:hypothetical protein